MLKDNNKPSRSLIDKGDISRKKVTKKKSKNTMCKGCNEEHKSIVNHLKRAFPCQNMYGVNEDDDLAPNKSKPDGQNKMNSCERTSETLCLNLNDSTDKTCLKQNTHPI